MLAENVSKSKVIVGLLRERLQSAEFNENERFPSEYALAAQYNVARPTITRALTQLVHEGYLRRLPRGGTCVSNINSIAGRNSDVALVVNDPNVISQSLMSQVLAGSKAVFHEKGYGLKLACIQSGRCLERSLNVNYRELVEKHQVRGLLIFADEVSDQQLEELASSRVYFVWAGYHTRLSPKWDRVFVDTGKGVEDAIEYLFSLGHRRIALINGQCSAPNSPAVVGKRDAYVKKMSEKKLDSDGLYKECRWDKESTELAVSELVSLRDRATGIICVDDYVAGYAIHALQRNHLGVPKDVSIIGFNDLKGADLINPALTTVDVYPQKLGRLAANLLLERFEDADKVDVGTRMILPKLILRASCAPLE